MAFMWMTVQQVDMGPVYAKAMEELKRQFEFRKWRNLDGDFCGARYTQDSRPSILCHHHEPVQIRADLRPLHLSRSRCADRTAPLDEKEVSCLRATNGSF